MLQLKGLEYNIRNVYMVSYDFLKTKEIDLCSLKLGYSNFLNNFQPSVPYNFNKDLIIDDFEVEKKLAQSYTASNLNDLSQDNIIGEPINSEDKKKLISKIKKSYLKLTELSSEVEAIFPLVIHSIFTSSSNILEGNKVSYGGSTSKGIGLIWISNAGEITEDDIIELLIHEMTHNLIFIDECCSKQFNYKLISNPANFALSAILKIPRPLDKVIHSIIVSTELLLARKSFLKDKNNNITLHPNDKLLLQQTNDAMNSVFSLQNLSELITDHMLEIIKLCRKNIKSL